MAEHTLLSAGLLSFFISGTAHYLVKTGSEDLDRIRKVPMMTRDNVPVDGSLFCGFDAVTDCYASKLIPRVTWPYENPVAIDPANPPRIRTKREIFEIVKTFKKKTTAVTTKEGETKSSAAKPKKTTNVMDDGDYYDDDDDDENRNNENKSTTIFVEKKEENVEFVEERHRKRLDDQCDNDEYNSVHAMVRSIDLYNDVSKCLLEMEPSCRHPRIYLPAYASDQILIKAPAKFKSNQSGAQPAQSSSSAGFSTNVININIGNVGVSGGGRGGSGQNGVVGSDGTPAPQTLGTEVVESYVPVGMNIYCQGLISRVRSKHFELGESVYSMNYSFIENDANPIVVRKGTRADYERDLASSVAGWSKYRNICLGLGGLLTLLGVLKVRLDNKHTFQVIRASGSKKGKYVSL